MTRKRQEESLFTEPVVDPGERPYTMRERALAGTLAGYRWPELGSFEKAGKKRQEAALAAARTALDTLAAET